MRRWLVLPIGLGLAVAAAWVWLAGGPPSAAPRVGGAPAPSPPSRDEIRPESREKLREILREADEAP